MCSHMEKVHVYAFQRDINFLSLENLEVHYSQQCLKALGELDGVCGSASSSGSAARFVTPSDPWSVLVKCTDLKPPSGMMFSVIKELKIHLLKECCDKLTKLVCTALDCSSVRIR